MRKSIYQVLRIIQFDTTLLNKSSCVLSIEKNSTILLYIALFSSRNSESLYKTSLENFSFHYKLHLTFFSDACQKKHIRSITWQSFYCFLNLWILQRKVFSRTNFKSKTKVKHSCWILNNFRLLIEINSLPVMQHLLQWNFPQT